MASLLNVAVLVQLADVAVDAVARRRGGGSDGDRPFAADAVLEAATARQLLALQHVAVHAC